MSTYDESNMSEAARRAYEAARRAFSDAPSVPAHGWRGTLEARKAAHADEPARAAEVAAETSPTGAAKAAASTQPKPEEANPTVHDRQKATIPSATLRERIDAARARQASPFARPENEDDDGYDPWSDRREELPTWEKDPWR